MAVMPPSTNNSCPFTKLESLEARKQRDRRDFFRLSHASARDQGFEILPRFRGENGFLHGCGNRTGHQQVYTDLPAPSAR